jgi:hypothetical protein
MWRSRSSAPTWLTLNDLAGQIEKLMKEVPGNQDVYTVENDGVQYLRVVVDRWPPAATACRLRTCRTPCACRSKASVRAR